MEAFRRIRDLIDHVQDVEIYGDIIKENQDCIKLLELLEETNPVNQRYYLFRNVIFFTFTQRKSYLDLHGRMNLTIRVTFIGFPMSLAMSGFLMKKDDEVTRESLTGIIREFSAKLKGTVVVLNSEMDIHKGYHTESTFTFYNHFRDFQHYVDSTRSSYHKKIKKSLEQGSLLTFTQISPKDFSQEHYALYQSVHERMKKKLITMPLEYFQRCEAIIMEIRDGTGQLLAFIQMKDIQGTLYFILGGFRKNEEEYEKKPPISHIDLYFSMLLYIVQYGINHDYQKIVLGQTAAESKSKIGAVEELRYLYVTSSNPLTRLFFRLIPGVYSFKPYGVTHKVFKDGEIVPDPDR